MTTLPDFIGLLYYNWLGNSKNATKAIEFTRIFLCMTIALAGVSDLKKLLQAKYLISPGFAYRCSRGECRLSNRQILWGGKG
jgi:hypothetical protein